MHVVWKLWPEGLIPKSKLYRVLVEAAVLVLPVIISILLPEISVFIILIGAVLCIYWMPRFVLGNVLLYTSKPRYSRVKTVVDSRCLDARIKPFLVSLRAFLMIQTCVNILAVDFPIYPRRFVKTELYGTSLMDIGVGSFLFCHGLVSGRSIAPIYTLRDCIRSLRGSLPMLILGLVRLSGIKAVDYQVCWMSSFSAWLLDDRSRSIPRSMVFIGTFSLLLRRFMR